MRQLYAVLLLALAAGTVSAAWISPSDWLSVSYDGNDTITTGYGTFKLADNGDVTLFKDGLNLSVFKPQYVSGGYDIPLNTMTRRVDCSEFNVCVVVYSVEFIEGSTGNITHTFDKWEDKISVSFTSKSRRTFQAKLLYNTFGFDEVWNGSEYIPLASANLLSLNATTFRGTGNNQSVMFGWADAAGLLSSVNVNGTGITLTGTEVTIAKGGTFTLDPTWYTPSAVISKTAEDATNTAVKSIDGNIATGWSENLGNGVRDDANGYEWGIIYDLGNTTNVNLLSVNVPAQTTSGDDGTPCSVVNVSVCSTYNCAGANRANSTTCSITTNGWNNCSFTPTVGRYVYLGGNKWGGSSCDAAADGGNGDEMMLGINEIKFYSPNGVLGIEWNASSGLNSSGCTSGSPCQIPLGSTFNLNADLKCLNTVYCDNVQIYPRYNSTSANPDRIINSTYAGNPLHINESTFSRKNFNYSLLDEYGQVSLTSTTSSYYHSKSLDYGFVAYPHFSFNTSILYFDGQSSFTNPSYPGENVLFTRSIRFCSGYTRPDFYNCESVGSFTQVIYNDTHYSFSVPLTKTITFQGGKPNLIANILVSVNETSRTRDVVTKLWGDTVLESFLAAAPGDPDYSIISAGLPNITFFANTSLEGLRVIGLRNSMNKSVYSWNITANAVGTYALDIFTNQSNTYSNENHTSTLYIQVYDGTTTTTTTSTSTTSTTTTSTTTSTTTTSTTTTTTIPCDPVEGAEYRINCADNCIVTGKQANVTKFITYGDGSLTLDYTNISWTSFYQSCPIHMNLQSRLMPRTI